jgi:hypothetical protein
MRRVCGCSAPRTNRPSVLHTSLVVTLQRMRSGWSSFVVGRRGMKEGGAIQHRPLFYSSAKSIFSSMSSCARVTSSNKSADTKKGIPRQHIAHWGRGSGRA